MRSSSWMWLAAALLAVAPAQSSAAPGLAAYGALPTVSEVEISPDGAKIALIVSTDTSRLLQIRETDGLKSIYLGALGKVKVRGLQWAGPRHLLVITSSTGVPWGVDSVRDEFYQLADLNLDSRQITPLLTDIPNTLNSISGLPVVLNLKGRPTVFVQGAYFPDRIGVLALFKIDLQYGHVQLVSEGLANSERFLVDGNGQPVARADYDQQTGRWSLSLKQGADWRTVHVETELIDSPSLLGLGRDGQSVLVRRYTSAGWSYHEAPLNTGAWSDPIRSLADEDIIEDPATHVAIGGVSQTMDHLVYSFLASQDQRAWDAVERAFPGEEVILASWSDDRKQIVVRVEGPQNGSAYFLVDLNKGSAKWLTDQYAGIVPEVLSSKQAIEYPAADGLKIPAYLTVPRDRPQKGLPLVVLVHGGPASRDEPGFDWWAQALASRGYAVLQPQYRGSSGLDEAHMEAGFGQWGRKMQSDLSDGVRNLASRGLIDPKRVCIMGASYGGYAALAGAVFDPAPYRCAVDIAGPSDLGRMVRYEREDSHYGDEQTARYWDRFMGAKSPDDRALDAISPALHADRAAIPVLIIHGQDDTVVRFDQSQEMADALRRAGKSVELVTLKSEDHWLSRGETRLQMLNAAVAFVEKNNPPDKGASAGASAAAAALP